LKSGGFTIIFLEVMELSKKIPLGIANSVSSNFSYDPFDALRFARQLDFELMQIYLDNRFLSEPHNASLLKEELASGPEVFSYFHSEGYLNGKFLQSDYARKLFQYLNGIEDVRLVIHFDETVALDEALQVIDSISQKKVKIYLENYFQEKGKEAAEKNMRKYMALYTFTNSHNVQIFPAMDIPRFFHRDIGMEPEVALNWCFQMINFFGNRGIPVLLHLIDSIDPTQSRNSYCPVGEGCIPYPKIFDFIRKTQPIIEAIILEYEDKINPLKSRENLEKLFFS